MKHDALLRARANTLNDIIADYSDEEYDAAERAIDLFLDYLEKDIAEAEEVHVTKTGSLEIKNVSNTIELQTSLIDSEEILIDNDDDQ